MTDDGYIHDGPIVRVPADQLDGMRAAIAANRRAIGLPPQAEAGQPSLPDDTVCDAGCVGPDQVCQECTSPDDFEPVTA